MTPNELIEAMCRVADEMTEGFDAELAALPKDYKIERKALTIQKKMSENSSGFVRIEFGGRYFEVRENIIFAHSAEFREYREAYNGLSDDDKKLFLVFAYPILMVRNNFYRPRMEMLENGETNAENLFEAKIITGTIGEILGKWQELWNEHGCMKCEVAL